LQASRKLPQNVSALPGGNRNASGSFSNAGSNGNWWSSTQNNESNAYNRNMNYNNDNVNSNNNDKSNGYSVRCQQDYSGTVGAKNLSPLLSPFFIEMHKAYLEARKHKRGTINQLKFERSLETELLSLCQEIETGTYELKPGICFINELPIKREIIAADFRDRVVHHFIYNRIYSIFDRKFIHDSYSCRVGKGTLFGIKRVQKFLKSHTNECWVLRLDIQGFFMAINREILFNLILAHLPNDELLKSLIRKVVFNEPLKNAAFRSPPSAWNNLPKDKSLMGSAPNCGLPIGNLTSQLFANVYLNPLDHFIKRELKIKYYGRYVDDMVLIHGDKRVLLNAISQIREFLSRELKLTLHPKKIKLQSASKGFAFLGAYISPFHLHIGKRIASNFRDCIFSPLSNPQKQAQRVQSYLGLLKQII
jgi:retron-type reverse transcriptase